MIHLYHGNGKGKTTAACGLAVRAAGSGMKVLFVQFFKSGNSSEIKVLSSVPSIKILLPGIYYGRYKNMTESQKEETAIRYRSFMDEVISESSCYDLIVLDESVSVYGYGLVDKDAFIDFLKQNKDKKEIVLTGREPADELKEIADYITEMRKEKHPFDKGVKARKGIEY